MPPGALPKIDDYGIIGDCRSAALVSKHGSLEFLCWPRVDSPTIFAALLDRRRGGYWSIEPDQPYTSEIAYEPDSNVLRTNFARRTALDAYRRNASLDGGVQASANAPPSST